MPHSKLVECGIFSVKRPKNKFYTEGGILVHGTINANDNTHIGDIIYNIERDSHSGSILFLRLDKKDETRYDAHLSVKSKHSDKGTWTTSGEKWCEQIDVMIPPQYFRS